MKDLWILFDTESPRPSQFWEDEPTLAQKQEAVGGLIEYAPVMHHEPMPFPTRSDGVRFAQVQNVIAHEEGRLVADPQPNILATTACFGNAFTAPYPIVGDCIIHVRYDPEGEGATKEEVDAWRENLMVEGGVIRRSSAHGNDFVPTTHTNHSHLPDYDADGEEGEETLESLADLTVDDMNEAVRFYHALFFGWRINMNPDKGATTAQGMTVFKHLTHEAAHTLNRLNAEAVERLKEEGHDAWSVCAGFAMVCELSAHIQGNMDELRQRCGDELRHAIQWVNGMADMEGIAISAWTDDPDNLRKARANFVLQTLHERMAARTHDFAHSPLGGGEAQGTLLNAHLLPPCWDEWIDGFVETLEGHTENAQGNMEEVFQDLVDRHAPAVDFDIDGDDNDDDPFSEVGA